MSESRDEARAAQELLPQMYEELRALAGGYLRGERAAHTLQPTALVHEAWMRMLEQTRVSWKNPGHLRAVTAQAMRRVLVDHARRKNAEKRGGGQRPVTMDSRLIGARPGLNHDEPLDVLAIEAALEGLAARNERQARIVEMRFFGGLTNKEVAGVLEVSETTVEDDWRVARAWLSRELAQE